MHMPSRYTTSWRPRAVALVGVAAGSVVLAACGGGSGSGVQVAASAGTHAGTQTATKTAFGLSSGPTPHLMDSAGRTVYEFSADASGHSHCSGGCAQEWPAVTSTTLPAATGGLSAARFAIGANHQVMYAGHPLYFFVGDRAAGDAKGQGLDDFGGLWSEVAADGAAIPMSAPGSSASSSSGGYGGYGNG